MARDSRFKRDMPQTVYLFFPHIGLIGIYDGMICRQRLQTLEIQERGNEPATFKG